MPPALEGKVLTTEPPGKSPDVKNFTCVTLFNLGNNPLRTILLPSQRYKETEALWGSEP